MKVLFALAMATLATRAVNAQTAVEGRPPVTVSVGGGMLMPYSFPERPTTDLEVSVQVPISWSLLVEGQVIRSTSDHVRSGYFDNRLGRPYTPFSTITTDHEALNVGANLLMRTGGPRLNVFYGGGLGVHHADTRMRSDTRCEARAAGGCDGRPDTTNDERTAGSGPSWQLVGGVETRIAPRLSAFGGLRWLTANTGDTGLGALGGIRAALQASPVQPQRAPTVRVSLASGGRRIGKLVSFSSSEVVVMEEGRTQTFPLDQVSRIERRTHHVRNGVLWGLILGFAGGYLGSCGGGDEEDCWPEVGALFAGVGAGTGALIGAGINLATAESRVLYSTQESAVFAIPLLVPRGAGVAVALSF